MVLVAATRRILVEGDLEIRGRILPASNLTYYAVARLGDDEVPCVYKPVSGERPLWDFPDGSLAAREVAAWAVSDALGWDVVPLTILRSGPSGPGMVQQWCEPDPADDPVDLVPAGQVPAGFLAVLDARDQEDRPVTLVHEDSVALRRMACFDVLVNNADRKGGHVLAMPGGHRFGVDHGVCFHVESKLRTVLWGWAAEPVPAADRAAVAALLDQLATASSPLRGLLSGLLTRREVDALVARAEALVRAGLMPVPSPHWPAIPWPAF